MNHFLEHNKTKIDTLCKNHKVKSLYAFGSVLTPKFNENSDIDLIVDFKQQDILEYASNYFNLKFALQAIFNREIDLLEEKADGTLVPLGQKAQFGTVKVKKGIYKLKKAI